MSDELTIAWIDNGMTEGCFTESLAVLLLSNRVPITDLIRVPGGIVARQRQKVLQEWYDRNATDWILWVDSDIQLVVESVEKLWNSRNPVAYPIISGVYYISFSPFGSLENVVPAIFTSCEFDYRMNHVMITAENSDRLVPIDSAGFGFLLMHRSLIAKMAQIHDNKFFFEEYQRPEPNYIGEDVAFFKKVLACNVQPVAHTGAIVGHMKKKLLTAKNYTGFSTEYSPD